MTRLEIIALKLQQKSCEDRIYLWNRWLDACSQYYNGNKTSQYYMHMYEVSNSFIVVMLLECSFCLQSSSRKLSLNETLRQKRERKWNQMQTPRSGTEKRFSCKFSSVQQITKSSYDDVNYIINAAITTYKVHWLNPAVKFLACTSGSILAGSALISHAKFQEITKVYLQPLKRKMY